jgi:hypothetical protein
LWAAPTESATSAAKQKELVLRLASCELKTDQVPQAADQHEDVEELKAANSHSAEQGRLATA